MGTTQSPGAGGAGIQVDAAGGGAAGGSPSPGGSAGPGGVIVVQGGGGQSAGATPIDARPAALVNGRAVDWGELRPIVAEAAGAEALREVILDRRLADALKAAEIVITPDDLAGERMLMLQQLDPDPNQAIRLLTQLRERQRLGPHRFERMLRRNAGLRAMVRHRAEVTEALLRQQFEIMHGPRRQVRLIVVSALAEAEEVARQVGEGALFGEIAARLSLDSSAGRGGLLEPISSADASYPKALRDAAFALQSPGDVSSPILLDGQFAVIQLVKDVPADGVRLEDARPELERIVRLSQEQALMDQLARQLLADVAVTIFDESLSEAWNAAKRQRK